jgi:hypothetical protein
MNKKIFFQFILRIVIPEEAGVVIDSLVPKVELGNREG